MNVSSCFRNLKKCLRSGESTEKKGRLFVEVKVGGQVVKALVDTGASNNFLQVEEARKLGIKYTGP